MPHGRLNRRTAVTVIAGTFALVAIHAGIPATGRAAQPATASPAGDLRPRLEKGLDQWCRWLSGYLYQIPGTDLYSLNPTFGTGNNPYRDIAGNCFAAAAGYYWIEHAKPSEDLARPIRGLMKLVLGSHMAIRTIDRPDVVPWGATYTMSDDWHACLHVVVMTMLTLDGLPDVEKEQLRKILKWEADKRTEYGISKRGNSMPAVMPGGSHGEANAWTDTLMQLARINLKDAPDRQDAWHKAAVEFSLNAICVAADTTSDEVIAGKPLKEQVKGANFEPGGIQEHHGFYHPGYIGWPLAYQAFSMLLDEQMPEAERNPDVYLHNYKMVFDRLKQGTLSNGRFIHCAGDDWITYGYGNAQILPAAIFAAARFKDPDATRIADQWLKIMELQQALTGGAIPSSRLAAFQRLHVNDISWYEAEDGAVLAQGLWVLDRIDAGKIPPASTEEQYNARNVGTYNEPNAKVTWHRDAKRWASFCWRSCYGEWQAIVQPVGLPNLLKYNHNSMGILEFMGARGGSKILWHNTETLKDGGFWSLGSIDRESKSVIATLDKSVGSTKGPLLRQHQALVVLPEGPSIFVDQCQALDQLWIQRTGALGLRLAADIFNGNKVNLSVNGEEKSFGPAACKDTWHDLKARSITIEKLMTIHAIAGEGSFQLLQKRQRDPNRAELLYPNDPYGSEESLLSHELYFGPPAYDRLKIISPNEWFRNAILVVYCDPAATPAKPTAVVTGEHPCFAISLPEIKRTVAINFADTEQTTDSAAGKISVPARSVKVVP